MQFNHNEGRDFPLSRFESMLKTNDVLFFDLDEFELIICHYLGIGKMALARKAANLGLEQHPNASSLKLLKVEVLLFENKLGEANTILDSLHELEPSNPDVYIHKANILSKQDCHVDAIDLLELASEILEGDEEVYSLLAMEHMFLEEYEEAKYNFMKCLEIDEEDSAALYNIVYCFDFLNQRDEAINFLNIYLDKNPYSEVAWHQIGRQYVAIEDYEKALASFDFAIISDDTFVGAYMEKGKVLEKMKRHHEAIESYQTTLDLDDPTAFAYLRIGRCCEKTDESQLALQFYNKALQEDPLLDKTWIAITNFYLRKKEYRQALYYIEKALAIDEENVLYWKCYAKINERLKRIRESEKGYRKTLELGNYELETWVTRCDILIEMRQFETALEVMKKAREFYPHAAEIEYRLAGLYFSLSNKKQGLFHLKKALKIDGEYAMIIEELFPEIFKKKTVQNLLAKGGFFR